MGYHRAGFDVVGVDIAPQPHYPFAFVQGDALRPPVDLSAFDAIHASPPCQAFTAMANRWRGAGGLADERPDLVGAVRAMLKATSKPYAIENVRGAPLRSPIELTGEMFGLRVHRPRLFETDPFVLGPSPGGRQHDPVAVYGRSPDGRLLWKRADGSEHHAPHGRAGVLEAGAAMGIDWMDWDELRESIPPAYTEFIGRALLNALPADPPICPRCSGRKRVEMARNRIRDDAPLLNCDSESIA